MQQPYLKYHDEIENRRADENEMEKEISDMYAKFTEELYYEYQNKKELSSDSQVILKAELHVYEHLPEHLSQGLFKQSAIYPAIVRFSTTPGDIFPDIVSSLQGLAIKVIGVKGDKILAGKEAEKTQDFILVNLPSMPKGMMESYQEEKKRLEEEMEGEGEIIYIMTELSAKIHKMLSKLHNNDVNKTKWQLDVLKQSFYSLAAFRYGDYVAKIIIKPLSDNLKDPAGYANVNEEETRHQQLQTFFLNNEATYELSVQLCTDTLAISVEDPSVIWSEAISPCQPVAKIVIPAQNANSLSRKQYAKENLVFNPWHSLEEHRPLGNLMRLRRYAYEESNNFRRNINVTIKSEPISIAELPD